MGISQRIFEKIEKKLWPKAEFERTMFDFPIAVTPDTSIIQDINDSAVLNSAVSGKKNSDYWMEYYPFKKFFRRKIFS